MHRTLSRAASPWPAPRRSEAACTAPSSPCLSGNLVWSLIRLSEGLPPGRK
jgi:hypothetical protein